MTLRIRHLAHVNPGTLAFDALAPSAELTFMPLETVWADARLDTSRFAIKADVSSGYVRFQDGDVLVPKTAPTFQHARATVIRGLTNGLGAGSSELHLLRPRSGSDARFLAYVTRSATFVAQGVASYQGVAGLQRVPADFVANWPITSFTREEQQRIADFLDDQVDRIDRAVALRHRQSELLTNALSSAAERLLVGGGATDQRQVPLRRLVRSIKTGATPTPEQQWVWVEGEDASSGLAWLSPASFSGSTLSLGPATKYIDRQAASLFPRFGANSTVVIGIGATAGRVAHLDEDATGNQQLTCLEPSEAVVPRYLTWSLWCRQTTMRATAPFTTLPIINNETLRALEISHPSRADQERMIEELDERADHVGLARRHMDRWISVAQERKQALITAAVTGQFDVTTARAVA
ncbi:restriction endonuclease subunit S [Modestobacter lapidis]|nr:hypothetical protein [Modestobacter lapidis]